MKGPMKSRLRVAPTEGIGQTYKVPAVANRPPKTSGTSQQLNEQPTLPAAGPQRPKRTI